MLDLSPATLMLTGLVEGVRDDQLNAPTPCDESSVGDLLDHVDGLSLAFTAAATKAQLPGGSQGPSADGSRLGTDWRARIAQRLERAGRGLARPGGVDRHDESGWPGPTG